MTAWLGDVSFAVLYPAVCLLMVGVTVAGNWLGRRFGRSGADNGDIGTLAGGALGLLALLLGFTFTIALTRYDVRRDMILEEANAITSTANFALMLPAPAPKPILDLLREYTDVRIAFGAPRVPGKLERDTARSLELQTQMWQRAVEIATASPQSLAVHRFVNSLNEVNNIHERRLNALAYHIPIEITFMLLGVAMVAMGITGYHIGSARGRRHAASLLMALTVGAVMTMIIDLDRPYHGLIEIPISPLTDAAAALPAGPVR
jgi:hypothetical protein